MSSEQEYMPRPPAQGSGILVGVVAILGLLLVLGLVLGAGGWYFYAQAREQQMRAVEAEYQARAEALRAQEAMNEAKKALAEAERVLESQTARPPDETGPP